MSTFLPHSSTEFKLNEVLTLSYIQARGIFDSDFEVLARSITKYYNIYYGVKKNQVKDFEFDSDFDIEIEGRNHRIILHAVVNGDYSLTTYSIGICSSTEPEKLIRRFHFDYVHNNSGKRQKVPISHLQYGGKSGNKFQTAHLEDWLSEPRLFYPPINLALLLDLVFCEFRSEKTTKITDSPEWRSLIKENEIFVYKDYYKAISNHIGTTRHTKINLVRDLCVI